MTRLTNTGEIRESIQLLDTAALQWLNMSPPDRIQSVLKEAHDKLDQCYSLCDTALKIALVGEPESGKTVLLNSILDTLNLVAPSGEYKNQNILELKVSLRSQESPLKFDKAEVVFFNDEEIWGTLNYFLSELNAENLGLPKSVTSQGELSKLEDNLYGLYQKAKNNKVKYALMTTLEFVMAIKANQAIVLREENYTCRIEKSLIPYAFTGIIPEISGSIQNFYSSIQERFDRVGAFNINDKATKEKLEAVLPLIKKVKVECNAWAVPFGVENPEGHNPIIFIDYPELDKELMSPKNKMLWLETIQDVHSIIYVMNGADIGAAKVGALYSQAGKFALERTLVVVNRFSEFQPLPTGKKFQQYYSSKEGGKKAGFATLMVPAKNLMAASVKQFKLYLCSAVCYLYEKRTKRSHRSITKSPFLKDGEKEACYSQYKRCEEDFRRIVKEIEATGKSNNDYMVFKDALSRYLDGAGVDSLRKDIINFAKDKGGRAITDNVIKEFRAAYRMLDNVAPTGIGEEGIAVNSEVNFKAQEFYRILELAVADALESGPSEYKTLKLKYKDKDLPLWEIVEKEIAAKIVSWPEWFAILNKGQTKKDSRAQQPQRKFGRYNKIKKSAGVVPEEFKAFNERFKNTADEMKEFALERIAEAIQSSVERFERHPDYEEAKESFQSVIDMDKLSQTEESLPIMDSWEPSRMVEDLQPEVLERINDEITDLENIRYPYDGEKPCFWNIALVIRIQVQLVKTLRDKISRLIAAAENNFQGFFINDVLRSEILPLVRSYLNNSQFLAEISALEVEEGKESSWEDGGKILRVAIEKIKQRDSVQGLPPQTSTIGNTTVQEEVAEDVEFDEPEEHEEEILDEPEEEVLDEPEEETLEEVLEEPEEEVLDEPEEEVLEEEELQEEFVEEDESLDKKKNQEVINEEDEFEEW